MKTLLNNTMRVYLEARYRRLQKASMNPGKTQQRWFRHLLTRGRATEFGRAHGFSRIRDHQTWAREIPVQNYETLRAHISRMMHGEENVLWPGRIKWFAKSSGTTTDRSKYIPVSRENMARCHAKGSWDTLALIYHQLPNASVFVRKNLIMGGSVSPYDACPETHCGDVSAVMMHHLPIFAKPFMSPDFNTALMDNWEDKIERMAQLSSGQDVGMFGGVPTWLIVLFRRILEITGKDHMLEVWPNAELYAHGGVGFSPYKGTFSEFFPSTRFCYQEVYNATEGYFATQDRWTSGESDGDMLLLLDNGMFFEFIPESEWNSEHPHTVTLADVETGRQYALVVSTNSGLWRYTPGDTVMFTSRDPYRIRVTGRTQQYINAFGEEVMIDNVDRAIAIACEHHGARITEFTVAPVYLDGKHRGAHEWFVEFSAVPADLEAFRCTLDETLQSLNSDYAAKRTADLALEQLHMTVAPEGTFTSWMAYRGKFGGQNKIPRLSNDRRYVDDLQKYLARAVSTN
jgi:hypothetical protein